MFYKISYKFETQKGIKGSPQYDDFDSILACFDSRKQEEIDEFALLEPIAAECVK